MNCARRGVASWATIVRIFFLLSGSCPRIFSKLSTAELSKPFSRSSETTPSAPILSSLSKLTHTEESVSSANPQLLSIALRTCLSFTRTVNSPISSASRAFAVTAISSISHSGSGSPITSISHCINSRSLPFCGFSARYTLSV